MKKIKVSEATGAVLDWMVAKCENSKSGFFHKEGQIFIVNPDMGNIRYFPSTNWAQGGPIIDRERIRLHPYSDYGWHANLTNATGEGDTALIAAMRCFVISKLGEEVEVPDELVC